MIKISYHSLFYLCMAFLTFAQANAQERSLTGSVSDRDGNALEGVSVSSNGKSGASFTDKNGDFRIIVAEGAVLLNVSFIGFQAQEVSVDDSTTTVDIVLESATEDLNEVVVVGYGTMKRSDITGAVASVDAGKLNTIPAGNAVEALQGNISGVDIAATTSPGETPRIRVRGNRSLNASNEPLYVVDGIPRNTIADIPVNDIESTEVLKDAASTAIYGSRGANGVILITTKRARANSPTSVSYNSYVGMNRARFPELMNGEEYIHFRKDVFRATHNDGWQSGNPTNEQVFAPSELDVINSGDFVDWQDLLYRKESWNQEHNLSISHGSEKTQAMIFLSFRNEQGYYKTNDVTRYNMGVNLDHQINAHIKVGLSSRLSNMERNLFWAPAVNLLYMNPLSRPYDEAGNMIWNPSIQQTAAWNILANYEEPYVNNENNLRSFNVLYAEFKLMDGLTLRSNLGVDLSQGKLRQYYGSMTSLRFGRIDYARKDEEMRTGILWDNILTYNKDFGKHSLNTTAVASYQQQVSTFFWGSGEGFPGEELQDWNLGTATQNLLMETGYEKWVLGSLLGRFQYGFDSKYLFNFSFRADGSSVLAEGNKFGYFPAASAAWVIDREDFFQSQLVNSLKLRMSYGVVGNSAIDPYSTIAGTAQTTYNFGDQTYFGYRLGGLVNRELGWEYSSTYNIGLDFALWRNRVSGTLEFYNTSTSDLLMERSLPEFTGSASVFQNVGRTSNSGFEAMISTINLDRANFSWSTDLNFYTNRERIKSLLSDEDMVGNGWFIGHPIGVYYDYEKLGIWQLDEAEEAGRYQQNPGDPKLRDQNGDGIVDADNDRVVLGQTAPKFGLFLRNNFNYKGITFSVALEGKFGHLVNSAMLGGEVFYDGTRWGPQALAGNYWTPDNPAGEYPYVNRAIERRSNLFGIRQASYLNVQEISMGYSFENRLKPFKMFNVYGRVRNPFYLYTEDKDLDPQAPNFDFSAYRVFVLGFNITI